MSQVAPRWHALTQEGDVRAAKYGQSVTQDNVGNYYGACGRPVAAARMRDSVRAPPRLPSLQPLEWYNEDPDVSEVSSLRVRDPVRAPPRRNTLQPLDWRQWGPSRL